MGSSLAYHLHLQFLPDTSFKSLIMLFTFKTVALAVLAVVAVGNVGVRVQGAPLPPPSSPTSLVEGSVAQTQTQGSTYGPVRYVLSFTLVCLEYDVDDDVQC